MAKEGLTVILAYVGPETILPLTSAVAAVAGVFLLGGRGLLRSLMVAVQAARRFGLAVRRVTPGRRSVGPTD